MVRDPRIYNRPREFPQTHPCRLAARASSQLFGVHYHRAYVDAYGNGVTDIRDHQHEIRGGTVLPVEDGHWHQLTTLLCGRGM